MRRYGLGAAQTLKMMDSTLLLPAVLMTALAALCGALVVQVRAQREMARLREENAMLETTLLMERRSQAEKVNMIERAREQLAQTFNQLSHQAIKDHTQQFLKLAKENLRQISKPEARDDVLEEMLIPVRHMLEQASQDLEQLIAERDQTYARLQTHLQNMSAVHYAAQRESRLLLSQISNGVLPRGAAMESLKRLVEITGTPEWCKFVPPTTPSTESERPDLLIHLPYDRLIAVDSGAPLEGYEQAEAAPDPDVRAWHLERHARRVRERVRELTSRHYWSHFRRKPDFLVLYVPADSYLAGAMHSDPELIDYAQRQLVVFATPATVLDLLRTAALAWQRKTLAENAERIRDLGDDLFKQLSRCTGDLERIGSDLNHNLERYSKAVQGLDAA